MILRRYSPVSKKYNAMNLPISGAKFVEWTHTDMFVEDFFPELSPAEQEFMVSGILPEEFEEWVGEI